MSYINTLPVRLLLCLLAAVFLGPILPFEVVRGAYTLSVLMMDGLMFFLPFIVFILIFSSFLENNSISFKWLVVMLLGSVVSNIVALWVGYGSGLFALTFLDIDFSQINFSLEKGSLIPLFKLPLCPVLQTDKSAFLAIFLGFSLRFLPSKVASTLDEPFVNLKRLVFSFIQLVFVRFLPVYIIGFGLKLGLEGTLQQVVTHLGPVFVMEWVSAFLYLMLFLWVVSVRIQKPFKETFMTLLPAGTVGFSTMSSAASLPLILQATDSLGKKPAFCRFSSPFLANVHMIGDDVTLVILSLFLVTFLGGDLPTPWTFFLFSSSFFLAKFSCVGVPGASVLVVLPVLQQYFGFSNETLTLITTLYILQDPLGTFTNVMGTGGLVSMLSTWVKKKPSLDVS